MAWRCAALPLLIAGALAGAGSPGFMPEVRSEKGRRLTSEKVVGSSFELSALHTVRFDPEHVVHTRHEVIPRDPSSRRLGASDVAFTGSRRDVVRSFMALCIASYSNAQGPHAGFLDSMMAEGDSIYGPNITTIAQELETQQALYEEIVQNLEEASDEYGHTNTHFDAEAISQGASGVAAMEFYKQGFGTVLVFRGTATPGDLSNFVIWTTDWILTRMTAQMKYQWVNRAGLEWTDEMAARDDMHFDILTRMAFSGGSWATAGPFLDEMVNHSLALEDIDSDEVGRTAYWEFTKAIADSVRESASAREEPLWLTGHSQGATRAALVSMYYEKRYNESIQAITFSGIGTSCFARGNAGFGGTFHMDLTADVDPFIHHPQITDYVHVLDSLGFMDYDAGSHCIFGTSDIDTSAAKRWCQHQFGHSATHLFSAGALGRVEIDLAFARCRYLVHDVAAMVLSLDNENYLFEDGTTDGGCTPAGPISREDPQELCNTGVGLREVDGCNDQHSCEACSLSSSADLVGFKCFWCASSASCHARGVTWLSGCNSGYVGNISQCEAGGVDQFNSADAGMVSGGPPQTPAGGGLLFAQAVLALLVASTL